MADTVTHWLVEITVEGFGTGHVAWPVFTELASSYESRAFRWRPADVTPGLTETVRLRATVDAGDPADATRRVMSIVRYVGRRADREGAIDWGGLTGWATPHSGLDASDEDPIPETGAL